VFPKPQTYRSEKYLAFVRSLSCSVCVEELNIIPHHTGGGMGLKGSDLSAIPLCHEHHDFYHRQGKDTFAKTYMVDLWEVRARTLEKYVEEKTL